MWGAQTNKFFVLLLESKSFVFYFLKFLLVTLTKSKHHSLWYEVVLFFSSTDVSHDG